MEQQQTSEQQSNFVSEARLAMQVFLMDKRAMKMAAKSDPATTIGTMILFVPFVIKVLLTFVIIGGWHPTHHPGLIINFFGSICALLAPYYIARGYFGKDGDLEEYYRVSTYARIPHVGTILFALIPGMLLLGGFIDFLIDVWMLWVVHTILMEFFDMEEMDALKIVGVTLLGYIIVIQVFALIIRVL